MSAVATVEALSPWGEAWRVFRSNKAALLGLAWATRQRGAPMRPAPMWAGCAVYAVLLMLARAHALQRPAPGLAPGARWRLLGLAATLATPTAFAQALGFDPGATQNE